MDQDQAYRAPLLDFIYLFIICQCRRHSNDNTDTPRPLMPRLGFADSSIPSYVLDTDTSRPIHSAVICYIDVGSNISAQLYSVRVDLRVTRIEK